MKTIFYSILVLGGVAYLFCLIMTNKYDITQWSEGYRYTLASSMVIGLFMGFLMKAHGMDEDMFAPKNRERY